MAEAYKFMDPRSRPRNVKMCFTFADGDNRKGRVISFSPNGGVNNSPIDEYMGNLRMQVDQDAQIR